jgi:hypothetical protein
MKVKLILENNYFNSTFSKIKLKNMKNKALLVGINKYPDSRNELRGCINDILDMEHLIAETNKVYAKQNIKKLTDRQATKKEIVSQIKWLVEGAAPGDQLLFHYSGHGAQAPTLSPKLETDGLDEIICPYDYDGSNATTLRDKEFAQLFAGIPKGVHFVWISDSCHAEDLSRDLQMPGEPQYRYFNGMIQIGMKHERKENEGRINEVNELSAFETHEAATIITAPLNGALLSACASHELSADAYIDKRFNGAFTHYLIKNLLQYSDSKSMQAIVQLVNIDLDKNGYDQNPESEGKLQNDFFFL